MLRILFITRFKLKSKIHPTVAPVQAVLYPEFQPDSCGVILQPPLACRSIAKMCDMKGIAELKAGSTNAQICRFTASSLGGEQANIY